jgi:hypothetical protein
MTRPSQYCFDMEIPPHMYKEFQRLEQAEKRDSKHFVQCPKCGDWLDLRGLGQLKRESNSWWYVAVGLFGMGMGMMILLVTD